MTTKTSKRALLRRLASLEATVRTMQERENFLLQALREQIQRTSNAATTVGLESNGSISTTPSVRMSSGQRVVDIRAEESRKNGTGATTSTSTASPRSLERRASSSANPLIAGLVSGTKKSTRLHLVRAAAPGTKSAVLGEIHKQSIVEDGVAAGAESTRPSYLEEASESTPRTVSGSGDEEIDVQSTPCGSFLVAASLAADHHLGFIAGIILFIHNGFEKVRNMMRSAFTSFVQVSRMAC